MMLSPEQELVIHNRILKEYTKLVTSPTNLINLTGHQPSLIKIRKAYHSNTITEYELHLVLNNLAIKLKGEEEPFEDKKAIYKYMFGNDPRPIKLSPPTLSAIEQAAAIQRIMPKKKKPAYTGPRKKKVEDKIKVSILPESLRALALGKS